MAEHPPQVGPRSSAHCAGSVRLLMDPGFLPGRRNWSSTSAAAELGVRLGLQLVAQDVEVCL